MARIITQAWDYEAEFKRYTDCTDVDREIAAKFLDFKFIASSIETPEDLGNYQCPVGSLNAFATQDFSWCPFNARSSQLAPFD